MYKEIILLFSTWCIGLFIILLSSLIVKIFGKEVNEDKLN